MARKKSSAYIPVEESPFRRLATSWRLLCTGPEPLAVNTKPLGYGLPERPVPLTRLRREMADRRWPPEARNAVIAVMLRRAQQRDPAWLVGLAGMMLPGLTVAARPLVAACPHRAADIEAEMLTGLVDAVFKTSPDEPGIAARLMWQAKAQAERVVREETPATTRVALPACHSMEPPPPVGHPDLVLAEAVRRGVLSADNAVLISRTRLGGRPVEAEAADLGISPNAAYKRRDRAEEALVKWLRPEQTRNKRRKAANKAAS